MLSPEQRREIEELLPLYANGRVGAEDRARVERALEEDTLLRTELDFLVRVRRNVKQSAQDQGLGMLGERRLLKSVRKQARRASLRRTLRPALALAAGIALLGQTFVIASLWQSDDGLTALGQSAGVVQVRFAADVREAEIRELLLDEALRIVDGPSALGVYRLAAEPDADLDALIARLRAEAGVIDHVARE